MSPENLSRRAILAGAASVPTLAVPAVAFASTEPDPIFAAVAEHRTAWSEFEKNCTALDLTAPEAKAEWERLYERMDDAAFALLEVIPTTPTGAATLLRYSAEFKARGELWPECVLDDKEYKPSDGINWHITLERHVADPIESMGAAGEMAVQS